MVLIFHLVSCLDCLELYNLDYNYLIEDSKKFFKNYGTERVIDNIDGLSFNSIGKQLWSGELGKVAYIESGQFSSHYNVCLLDS